MEKRIYENLKFISKDKFEKSNINKKVSEKDWKDYNKLRNVVKKVEKNKLEIEYFKDEIRELQKQNEKYSKISTELYNRVNYIFDDYQPNIYIGTQIKKNSKGELLKFWMINVKYKKNNKPIYLGSDKKVREILCKRNNKRLNISEEKLKGLIKFELVEEIWDWVIEERENIFNINGVNMDFFLNR